MMKMWRAFARKEDDEDIFGGAASEIINVNDLEYSNKSAQQVRALSSETPNFGQTEPNDDSLDGIRDTNGALQSALSNSINFINMVEAYGNEVEEEN